MTPASTLVHARRSAPAERGPARSAAPSVRRAQSVQRALTGARSGALAPHDALVLQRSLGNHAVVSLVAAESVQRAASASKLREQEIERRKSAEGFGILEGLLANADAVTTVRIAVRAAAAGAAGRTAGVGHAAIQVHIASATAAAEGSAQLGLDNGGLVKMEGQVSEELQNAKYRLTFVERQITRDRAGTFLWILRGEVGRTHSYMEKLHPGSYYLGYENCTSWAEDMADEAGLALPKPSAVDLLAFYPRPTELDARIRGGAVGAGQTRTNVDALNGHLIGDAGARASFTASNVIDRNSTKWMLVQGLVADLEAGRAKRDRATLCAEMGVAPAVSAAEYLAIEAQADQVFAGQHVDVGGRKPLTWSETFMLYNG